MHTYIHTNHTNIDTELHHTHTHTHTYTYTYSHTYTHTYQSLMLCRGHGKSFVRAHKYNKQMYSKYNSGCNDIQAYTKCYHSPTLKLFMFLF